MIKSFHKIQGLIAENLEMPTFNPSDNIKHQENQLNELSNLKIIENEILFFRNNTKQLITCDLDSLETQTKDQNSLPEIIDIHISICEIPKKSKFCYGNTSGLTFIVDQKKNVFLLPNGKPSCILDSNYHNNYVYVIGGIPKLSERFNLTFFNWESCAAIPFDHDFYCSRSAILGNQILIVGFYIPKVISYDVVQNKYHELSGILLALDAFKFVFTAESRVYIGENQNNIYESALNDTTRWTCISRTNSLIANYIQVSYYTLIDDSVFFLTFPNKLYEFKMKTKEIKHIKDL